MKKKKKVKKSIKKETKEIAVVDEIILQKAEPILEVSNLDKPEEQPIDIPKVIDNIIRCPNCKKELGEFDGKTATAFDGIHTANRLVYFVCSSCGIEVEVCENTLSINLFAKKSHKHF